MLEPTKACVRIDKWLWYARFFKSRALSAKMAESGKLRINRKVVHRAGRFVKPGDVLTFPKGIQIRVIQIMSLGERRGPAKEAEALYNDLNPIKLKLPITSQ